MQKLSLGPGFSAWDQWQGGAAASAVEPSRYQSLTGAERQLVRLVFASGAIQAGGHYAYKSGRHSDVLVEKDLLLARVAITSKLCYQIAKHYFRSNVQAVAGPSMGGATMAQWVAYFLEPDPVAVYAEDEAEHKVFRRGFADLIQGKRTLIVDDVVDTGGSAHQMIDAARNAGAEIVGIGTLWNRGEPTLDGYQVYGLINQFFETYLPTECPMCRAGVPLVDATKLRP